MISVYCAFVLFVSALVNEKKFPKSCSVRRKASTCNVNGYTKQHPKSIQEHIYFGGMSSLGDSDNAKMWLDFSDKIEEILKEHEPKSNIKIENKAAYILLQSDTKILCLKKTRKAKKRGLIEKGSGIHVDVEGKVQIPLPAPTQMSDWHNVAQNQFPLQNEPVIAYSEDEFFAMHLEQVFGRKMWVEDTTKTVFNSITKWKYASDFIMPQITNTQFLERSS